MDNPATPRDSAGATHRSRPHGPARPLTATVAATALLLGLHTAVAGAADAAPCSGQVRYAASTNTLYLTSGTADPAGILALCPSAPLTEMDDGVWQLNANLVIQNGATLELHGSAAGGSVDTLRLRSLATSAAADVVSITAQYGTIDIDSTVITSWDDAAGGPDTDPSVPTGAPAGSKGRAFIRALSYLDAGVPRESRMDIVDSDLGYLGYYAAESYGVSYKGRGCDATHLDVCAALNVYGSQINSRFHHNYMGTYTFNAEGMVFDGNEYDNNKSYGLDPHDDSDNLVITDNHAHHNGNHGIICSQRCNNLLIARNESDHNGIPPYLPPGDPDASDNQVHGIMIHRGVTDSVIEDNYVHDQPNGAGIAVFDSSDDIIRNNIVDGAEYGLRYSVGSTGITTTGNTVTDSVQYAVFTYQGSDLPAYTNTTGRPTNLVFIQNTFAGSGSNAVKLNQSDGTVFTGNSLTGTFGSGVLTQYTTGTVFDGNTVPTSLNHSVKGDTTTPGSMVFKDITQGTKVQVDSVSSASFTSGAGTVYLVSGVPAATTALTANGGTTTLTTQAVGTSTRTVTPLPLAVRPDSGTATARVPAGSAPYEAAVAAGAAGTQLAFTGSGLTPGTTYRLTAAGVTVATGTATAQGTVTLNAVATTTAEVTYRISAAS
ncbi:right-handed parallel beta-helix repeat-containing protein [Streptomyces cavernae]|uniref:right-handed parallel beta-helix repeat-containing protein n=1 Tax=Streptomyces cavernae TaxID=2259034 RepID=UPI000FEC0B84|nr:right-handed parallel beta-helix repeat-containing protein [Streptomyces cavernae]